MQIFSLISQKGGAGKSTLARQLAVLAGEAGASVLIDRDPQETSTKWLQRRQALQPAPELACCTDPRIRTQSPQPRLDQAVRT